MASVEVNKVHPSKRWDIVLETILYVLDYIVLS
jgi:hypothetical protein